MNAYESELIKKRKEIEMLNSSVITKKRHSVSFNQSKTILEEEGGSFGVTTTK